MDKILIIDFGSQYTHLILKVIRKHNVYCEVLDKFPNTQKEWLNVRGVILSGGPDMVDDTLYNIKRIAVPILGICFGAQYIAQSYGCEVKKINSEYGRTLINIDKSFNSAQESLIFTGISSQLEVWMSHSNSIVENLSSSLHLHVLSVTENGNIAAFKIRDKNVYGLLFHPEVSHTNKGDIILNNFINICRCNRSWNPKQIVVEIVKNIKSQINNKERVIMAVSGGVDSTVAACLINKAIGKRLSCVFIDNGLLRENEYSEVLTRYKKMKLSVVGVDAKELFIARLKGIVDPEEKRKIIGATFIDIFTEHTKSLKNVPKFLGQGTIYSDVIESSKNMKSSRKIKSHHNVGGLPENLTFKLIEPLRDLFKDEVRIIGRELKIDDYILNRHPFPGPGLAIRIIGDVTKEKINILQRGDKIFTNMLRNNNLYDKIWQAGAILLNTKTVGVMGDERTYDYVMALRAVCSNEGMTANIYPFNMKFLENVSNKIINNVEGVNRVVYDISSKPPATIEWE